MDVLQIGPSGLGLRSTQAGRALCTATYLAYRPITRLSGIRTLQAVGIYRLAIIAFGLSTDVYLTVVEKIAQALNVPASKLLDEVATKKR